MKQRSICLNWRRGYRLDNDQSRPGHEFRSCITNTRDSGVVTGSSRCGDGVANMFLMSVPVMTLRLPRPEHSPTLDKRSSYMGPLDTGWCHHDDTDIETTAASSCACAGSQESPESEAAATIVNISYFHIFTCKCKIMRFPSSTLWEVKNRVKCRQKLAETNKTTKNN